MFSVKMSKYGLTVTKNFRIGSVTLADVCEYAEDLWYRGHEYVAVIVDGNVYMELES